MAGVANSQLRTSDKKLHVLISLKTAKPFEKFPATSKDVHELGLTLVEPMLNVLDADRTSIEEAESERLRMQIGSRLNPA